jgi:hypothetical protein
MHTNIGGCVFPITGWKQRRLPAKAAIPTACRSERLVRAWDDQTKRGDAALLKTRTTRLPQGHRRVRHRPPQLATSFILAPPGRFGSRQRRITAPLGKPSPPSRHAVPISPCAHMQRHSSARRTAAAMPRLRLILARSPRFPSNHCAHRRAMMRNSFNKNQRLLYVIYCGPLMTSGSTGVCFYGSIGTG